MSSATARYPASARAGSWWRHEYQSSGKPWQRTTGRPSPSSTTWSSIPFAATVRCLKAPHRTPDGLRALGAHRRRLAAAAPRGDVGRARLALRGLHLGVEASLLACSARRARAWLARLRGRLRKMEEGLDVPDLRDRARLLLHRLHHLRVLHLAAKLDDAVDRVHVDVSLRDVGLAEQLRLDLARDRLVAHAGLRPGRAVAQGLDLAHAGVGGPARQPAEATHPLVEGPPGSHVGRYLLPVGFAWPTDCVPGGVASETLLHSIRASLTSIA